MRFRLSAKAGFTLIEVLIAAVVLFSVVSSALIAFQVAMVGTQKASDRLVMLSGLAPIQSHIKKAIIDAQTEQPKAALNGNNNLLDISFNWQANVVQAAPPAARFDPETARFVAFEDRYLLYRVQLTLRHQTATEQFEYLELAIIPELREKS